jgi:PIN domain nuclease of toxin-antitoxin system
VLGGEAEAPVTVARARPTVEGASRGRKRGEKADDLGHSGRWDRVSAPSVWEIAFLVRRGRLRLTRSLHDWLRHAEAIDGARFIPVSNAIPFESVELPEGLHDDPADERLRACPHVRTFW